MVNTHVPLRGIVGAMELPGLCITSISYSRYHHPEALVQSDMLPWSTDPSLVRYPFGAGSDGEL